MLLEKNVSWLVCSLSIVVLLASMTLASLASAKEEPNFVVLGPGVQSCGKWTADRQAGPNEFHEWYNAVFWLQGYITALSSERGVSLFEHVDNKAISAWLDNYCNANPLDTILDASRNLARELERREAKGR